MTTYAEWHEEEKELSENEYEALTDYLNNQHEDENDEYDSDTVRVFQDSYKGQWDSFRDFVEEQFLELNGLEIPNFLRGYLDFDAIARDWDHNYWYSDNGHIFYAH